MSVFAMLTRPAWETLLNIMSEPVTFHIEADDLPERGVFTAAHESLDVEAGVPVSTVQPMLEIGEFDVSRCPEQGDEVTVRDKRYMIVDVKPDGNGFIQLMLQRGR